MTIKMLATLAAATMLAACASMPSGTETDFGKSKASLISAQTADPATLSSPSGAPVTGVEPDYATNVIEALREGVSKPADVKAPIEIKIGG
jgi:starvation-inducible outer membrane lipoprotein